MSFCLSASSSPEIGSSPLKGCEGNCGPGGKYWQPTAGFMTHVTCRLTAKKRDQLRNPSLGNGVWATFTFYTNTVSVNSSKNRQGKRITYLRMMDHMKACRHRCSECRHCVVVRRLTNMLRRIGCVVS